MEAQGQERGEPSGNQHIKANTEIKNKHNGKQFYSHVSSEYQGLYPQIAKKFLNKLSDGEWEPGQGGIKDRFSIVNLITL